MKNKRKSGFLLFWFSLLPGAGEMYLGFMRQGLSLMGLFWGIIALTAWLELGPFLLILPILFFTAFFTLTTCLSSRTTSFTRYRIRSCSA